MSNQHPAPWYIHEDADRMKIRDNNANTVAVFPLNGGSSKVTADTIVQCVNSHAALMEFVEDLANTAEAYHYSTGNIKRMAQDLLKTLKLAEAK